MTAMATAAREVRPKATVVQDDPDESVESLAYARSVGARLRAMRKQMGLSLQAVEAISEMEFKASVLGAYERGERAISVSRLQRLAKLYDVPVDQLLPADGGSGGRWSSSNSRHEVVPISAKGPAALGAPDKVAIDLSKLHAVTGPERDLLRRFLSMIQVHRQDFNGRMITIRAEDVRAIACLFGITPDSMGTRLDELGLLAKV
jgi:transcriptional regulator with XRE-family HTH domain